ncbi:MAG: ribonuclease H-like domain-containing protein [Candidatus Micrarchaeota archaeon]
MLENSFVHLPDFGPRRERRLWGSGVESWDDFLGRFCDSPYHRLACSILEHSKDALRHNDANYFGDMLPREDAWRSFPHFRRVAYLDIETTGLAPETDYVTVIGVFDGSRTHSYVHGQNLDEFQDDMKKYDLIVTFNGSLFDIPFLRKHIGGLRLSRLHVDLRFVLASLDVRGGLKKIEQKFGLEREDDLKGLTGYDAVKLWQAYIKRNDNDALDKLVRYNSADISNLKVLMEWSYKEKRLRTGFDEIMNGKEK